MMVVLMKRVQFGTVINLRSKRKNLNRYAKNFRLYRAWRRMDKAAPVCVDCR